MLCLFRSPALTKKNIIQDLQIGTFVIFNIEFTTVLHNANVVEELEHRYPREFRNQQYTLQKVAVVYFTYSATTQALTTQFRQFGSYMRKVIYYRISRKIRKKYRRTCSKSM